MSVQDPRARRRIPNVEPVRISSVTAPLITESTVTQNASPGGVRVSTQRIWRPGDLVRIEFLRSGFTSDARVAYWRSFSGSRFAMGLELLKDSVAVVQDFICVGFRCACGERVTVLRHAAASPAPDLLTPQTVFCRRGHAREINASDLPGLDKWYESERSAAPSTEVEK